MKKKASNIRRCVLLGPVFESEDELSQLLAELKIRRDTDFLIGVDDGARLWLKNGFIPDLAVGDWDSLEDINCLNSISVCLTLPTDKDRSDLYHAIRSIKQCVKGFRAMDLIALGVTGGRPDHHLASLSELMCAASMVARGRPMWRSVTALDKGAEYFFLSTKIPRWSSKLRPGRIVSVIALGGAVRGIRFSGFKYNKPIERLMLSSHGLSNEVSAVTGRCSIALRSGLLLVVVPKCDSR